MKLKFASISFMALSFIESHASTLIVDTFDQGGFERQLPNLNPVWEEVSLPFGELRTVAYGGNTSQLNAAVFRLTPDTGQLHFLISGTSSQNSAFPPSLALIYNSQQLNGIAGYTEFVLGFSQLTGVGDLYVELGATSNPEVLTRIPLNGAGEYRYPVSSVYANVGQTIEGFSGLRFVFEARSPAFSFALDEIRLVPEPSTTFTAAVAGMLLTQRRRRRYVFSLRGGERFHNFQVVLFC